MEQLKGVQCHPQGVQLSQLHQPSHGIYAKRAWRNAMPSYEFIGWCNVSLDGATLARLVHFLLWQAAKPSGDKCTP